MSHLVRLLFATAALAIGVQVQAVPLNNAFGGAPFLDTPLPGTTSALRPELAGTVLVDESQPFSFAGLNISGTVQSRVVRETTSGTLDFYWRILVDPRSTGGGIGAFRLIDFDFASLTDADWRIDGLGATAPGIGRLFNPADHPEGAINFLFDPNVMAGEGGSNFFFLHTSATDYARTAHYDLLGGPDRVLSELFSTYAPAAVPEPEITALMVAGLGLLGVVARRRRRS